MKNSFLLLLGTACCILFSCSDNHFEEEQSTKQSISFKSAADGKYDVLGYGYDITDEYLGVDAPRHMVIDIEAFVRENSNRFYTSNSTALTNEIHGGVDAIDLLQELNKSSNFKASAAYQGISDTSKMGFSGTFSKNKEYQERHTFSSKYSFSKARVNKRVKKLWLNADLEMIKPYVTSTFIADLDRLSPDDFIKIYGTHVLTNITIGGTLEAMYRSTIMDQSDYTRKKKTVESGASAALKGVGINIGSTMSEETINQLKEHNTNWRLTITAKGGENTGISNTYNSNGTSSITFNISSWESSVNATNSALIDVDWT
ncbi:hypothetical protein M2132_002415 [Dysgonomonas sp. PH5-45]|uniref:MAC/perforin domain-containing protein n=1 Tax=unclassified Dysgonomonas TaxID=2630389 RepID=UPI002473146D|nr:MULTISPECIES: MAC/perforin domain-containing protein [unclassified Dysgonomonas]MDH6356057.1 hypothetical protein [Dysgonomonas sp. PH5-45]MDH6388951.1 hypothetical protein [Dysgonomonas sp. PH5-37]